MGGEQENAGNVRRFLLAGCDELERLISPNHARSARRHARSFCWACSPPRAPVGTTRRLKGVPGCAFTEKAHDPALSEIHDLLLATGGSLLLHGRPRESSVAAKTDLRCK